MPWTERERDVLDFERTWFDSSDALAHDPLVVHRLRRQQDRARRARYQEVAR